MESTYYFFFSWNGGEREKWKRGKQGYKHKPFTLDKANGQIKNK